MKNPTFRIRAALWLSLLALLAAPAALMAQDEMDAPLKNGTVSAQLRLVYEHNDTDNATDAADAGTLRTRLGYRTGEMSGNTAFLQFQDVSAWMRNYSPLDADYDTVGDPEATTLHQVYVENGALPATRLRVGRQELQYENGRYVAVAVWRQNGQAFDAVEIENTSVSDLKINLGNAWKLLAGNAEFFDVDQFSFLVADYTGVEAHHIYVHAFLLDSPGDADTDRDNATYGARVTGDLPSVEYFLQYDIQQGYADNSEDGGSLLDAFVAGKFSGMRAGLGYNVVTGASGSTRAFDTLLGTTHAFAGWADQFTRTRGGGLTEGLVDTYLLVGGKHGGGYRWTVKYHQFEQEVESDPYGTEIDAQVGKAITPELGADLIYAMYTADSGNESDAGTADVTKYWLRVDYKF